MKQDEKQIMDELKREYESIPVPPQARARIMQGINQAKKEQKRGNYMKIMKSTGATAAAAMVMITVMANLTHCKRNGKAARDRLHRQGGDLPHL